MEYLGYLILGLPVGGLTWMVLSQRREISNLSSELISLELKLDRSIADQSTDRAIAERAYAVAYQADTAIRGILEGGAKNIPVDEELEGRVQTERFNRYIDGDF